MKYFYTLRSNRMLIGIIQKVLMHSSRKPEIIIYLFYANCNIKLSISSVRISLETARCGLGEEGAVGDRRGQAERAGQAAKILSISASKASSGVL